MKESNVDQTAAAAIFAIKEQSQPEKVPLYLGYFKVKPGQYGEGDEFIGVKVPDQRVVAKKFRYLPLDQIEIMLKNPIHEVRLTALFILVGQFKKAKSKQQSKIVELYLSQRDRVNNWDLVDSSASYILGAWLADRDRGILYDLAKSNSLWDRRIAIISTQYFIRNGEYTDTLKLADMLMNDKQDLIHKAVGWMLREVGNRDNTTLVNYLATRYKIMPRTMLRYAIEKFDPIIRKAYLKGEV